MKESNGVKMQILNKGKGLKIFGIPPLTFFVLFIILAGMVWYLISLYNENSLLMAKHSKCKEDKNSCYFNQRSIVNSYQVCESRKKELQNSNRIYENQLSSVYDAEDKMKSNHNYCVRKLIDTKRFFEEIRVCTVGYVVSYFYLYLI